VHADGLVLLTDVDALYDGPPTTAGSKRVPTVVGGAGLDDLVIGGTGSSVGSGGMVTKVEAASIANAAGITTVLTSADQVEQALAGEDVGTVFVPTGSRRTSRKLWLAHATTPQGRLLLDPGAVRAVTERRTSLLPAGITSVEGTFSDGDPVDLCAPEGRVIGRGLVNYTSAELPGMLGRSTRELAKELGPEYEREVVHRDDLVIL
jgi:glutamate 5-kinase